MFKPYIGFHKSLRHALGSVSLHVGSTDFCDDESFAAVEKEVRDLVGLLRLHASQEEKFWHPLVRETAPEILKNVEREHHDGEEQLDRVIGLVEGIRSAPPEGRNEIGAKLYLELNRFHSFYLEHLRREEEELLPEYLQRVPQQALLEVHGKLTAAVPPPIMMMVLRYQLPALTPAERFEMLSSMKARATPEAFRAVCGVADHVLAPRAWRVLQEGLGIWVNERVDAILKYWFGAQIDGPGVLMQRAPFWFANPSNRATIDKEVRSKFGDDFELAVRGELAEWATHPRGRLALIILLDQFSRNLYRDDPRAFEVDARALEIVEEGIQLGHDRKLHCLERMFFYMPFMHSETRELQERSLEFYQLNVAEAPEPWKKAMSKPLEKAQEHHRCVTRFGRYPHRNTILGRTSTPEEAHFLATELQPGRGSET